LGSVHGRSDLSRHYGPKSLGGGYGFATEGPASVQDIPLDDQLETSIDRRVGALSLGEGDRRDLQELKDQVRASLSRGLAVERVNVVGSFSKETQIRDEEGNDIDLQVTLRRDLLDGWLDQENGPRNCLTKVRSVLSQDPRYSDVEIRVDRNAVRAKFGDKVVDIVPVFREGGDVLIPDTKGGQSWIRSNPRLSKRLLDLADLNHRGRVKPIVKLVKDWNNRHGRRLSSYQIEAMVLRHFHEKPAGGTPSYLADLTELFGHLPWYLRKGSIRDPVDDSPLDTHLSPEDRSRLVRLTRREGRRLREAEWHARHGRSQRAARLVGVVIGDIDG